MASIIIWMDKPLALIVEDDRDIVALYRHVLDIAGYRTEIVLDGTRALERIFAIHPDIILLDLQLPGISGVEILTRIRSDPSTAAIPVVVITANANLAESLSVEPDLLLQKPVNISQLGELVQRLQATRGVMTEPVHDRATGLYTLPFFEVRMNFSLERIRQTVGRKFGVLFAELVNLDALSKRMQLKDLEALQRELAVQFKSTFRPTDTLAWSAGDGCFLSLIEEIPTPVVPVKIAARVRDSLRRSLEDPQLGLRANLGVLLCDTAYTDIKQITADLAQARALLREGQYASPAIFDHAMLHAGN